MTTSSILRSRGRLAGAVLGLAAALPIGVLVAQLPLPRIDGVTALAVLIVFCVVATTTAVLAPLAARFGKVQWAVLAAAFLMGWMLGGAWTFAPRPTQDLPFTAAATYPDGTRRDEAPRQLADWGKEVRGFALHPPARGVTSPHGVQFALASAPTEVDLLLAKPAGALFQNGRPTASDGISVTLSVRDSSGKAHEERFDLSQWAFLRERWIRHRVRADAGIASLSVDIGPGPPGSTPDFDSTLVAVEHAQAWPEWVARAKRLLFAWSFLALALYAVLRVPARGAPASPAGTRTPQARKAAVVAAAGLVLAVVYWSALHSNFIYYWDFRTYWGKTERLYEMARSGAWDPLWNTIVAEYAANYSMLPAIPPALASLLVGYPTRVTYTLLVTLLYAVPAYLVMCSFGQRLAGGTAATSTGTWLLAFLCVFLGLPQMLNPLLYLMPDVGGIVVWAGALLCADRALKALADSDPLRPEAAQARAELARSSLGLGFCLALMFLFRRWYVFASVGVAAAVALVALHELWRRRGTRRQVASGIGAAAMLVAFAALPVLSGVAFEWSRDLASHDYATLYAAYRNSAWKDLVVSVHVFGGVALAICTSGILIAWRARADLRLWVLLLVSALVACSLFFTVQSPGHHNYYLLMPLFGAGLFVTATALMRRFGRAAGIALAAVLLVGNVWATRVLDTSPWVKYLYPSYADWLPKRQPYTSGYLQAARLLNAPENKASKFCVVASSRAINEGVFGELWQLDPSFDKRATETRIVALSQVDTMNGPPAPNLRECALALVAVPFQYHLARQEQYTMEIVQQDILSGTGIGAAYQRAGAPIEMGDGIQLIPFRQSRPVSADEYQNLVRRFLKAKGPGYANPAPGLVSSAP